jgi:iron complex outermembrane recepter protein
VRKYKRVLLSEKLYVLLTIVTDYDRTATAICGENHSGILGGGFIMSNSHSKKFVRTALALSASVSAVMAAAPAFAQDKAEVDAASREIVVTAQFREQKLQDVPIAITAVSGEQIGERSQTSIIDVAGHAPNVTLTPAGAGFGNTATASIRGVGQYDFNFGLEGGVGMYLDDVYYGVLFGANFDVADVSRVEVLRGPQGTLAGKNSIGGSIKLFSQKPTGDTEGYVEGTYGSFNRVDLKAAANLTLIPDKLFARLSGMTKNRGGYVTSYDYGCATATGAVANLDKTCKIGEEGSLHSSGLRGQLRWLVADGIENNLSVDYANDTSGVQAGVLLTQHPLWAGAKNYILPAGSYANYATYTGHPGTPASFSIPRNNTVKSWGVANNLDVKLGEDISLKSITAFRRANGDFSQDIDLSPADVETIYNVVSHKQFSQELRLSGTVNDMIDWTVGGYYYKATQTIAGRKDIQGGLALGGGGIGLEFLDDDIIASTNKSGFAHVVVHPSENLSLTGGLRYSKDHKTYQFSRRSVAGVVLGFLPNGVFNPFNATRWDWRLGMDYRFSPNFMTYVQASTGYKGGGVNPRPFTVAQVQAFNPETLTTYELGFKSDLLDRKVRLNAAAFFNKYKDIQLTALACPTAPCALPLNAGNADVKGFEVELEARPVDGLTFDASLSHLNFKYKFLSANTNVLPGMIAPFTPKWKANAGIQYDIALPSGKLTPRIDWTYQSTIFSNAFNAATNATKVGSLFNAKLTYKNEEAGWETALTVTNLGDKYYFHNIFDLSSPPFFVRTGQPARPREWSVSVKKSF